MPLFGNGDALSHWLEWAGGTALMAALGLVMLIVLGPWLVDRTTPGCLKAELLGHPDQHGNRRKEPNLALAVVVASLLLGMAVVIAAAIK